VHDFRFVCNYWVHGGREMIIWPSDVKHSGRGAGTPEPPATRNQKDILHILTFVDIAANPKICRPFG